MSRWRTLGNTILTYLTKAASGYWDLMDSQNGYTAISSPALRSLDLKSIYPRYGYCNDILVMLNVSGFKVVDVAIPARYGNEESKIRYKSYIPRVSILLFKDFFWRLKAKYICKRFHPIILFYIIGFITTAFGTIAGVHTLYQKSVLGSALFNRSISSFLIFITGLLFLLFAMFFDMQENRRLKDPISIHRQ